MEEDEIVQTFGKRKAEDELEGSDEVTKRRKQFQQQVHYPVNFHKFILHHLHCLQKCKYMHTQVLVLKNCTAHTGPVQ